MFTGLALYPTVRLTMCSKTIFLTTIPTWDSEFLFNRKPKLNKNNFQSKIDCRFNRSTVKEGFKAVKGDKLDAFIYDATVNSLPNLVSKNLCKLTDFDRSWSTSLVKMTSATF